MAAAAGRNYAAAVHQHGEPQGNDDKTMSQVSDLSDIGDISPEDINEIRGLVQGRPKLQRLPRK
eukprot:6652231-Pyramimonas_sp.AAC.1